MRSDKHSGRKKGGLAALVVAGALTLGGAAHAQSSPPQGEDQVRYKRTMVVDFTGVNLEARVRGPGLTRFGIPKKRRFRNLIEVRRHFRPEMRASTDGI